VNAPLSARLSRPRSVRATAGLRHEERFPLPRRSGGCEFSQETFAGASGNDEDAPEAVVSVVAIVGASATEAVGKRFTGGGLARISGGMGCRLSGALRRGPPVATARRRRSRSPASLCRPEVKAHVGSHPIECPGQEGLRPIYNMSVANRC
jgi:hypothetical protein